MRAPSFQGQSGAALIDRFDLSQFLRAFQDPQNGITALAGGGAAGAPVLLAPINVVAICAAGNDSVMLPPATNQSPPFIYIKNEGNQTLAVFGNTIAPFSGANDTIAPNSSNAYAASQTLASTKLAMYANLQNGKWMEMLTA